MQKSATSYTDLSNPLFNQNPYSMYYKTIKPENIEKAKVLRKAGWKPINNFEQYYLVSEAGDIWSIVAGKIKSPFKTARGYLEAVLYKPGHKPKHEKVHRLVGRAFKKQPGGKDIIHHKDHNKLNNHRSNLVWESPSGNAKSYRKHKAIVGIRNYSSQNVA